MNKHVLHQKREFENVRHLIEWAGDEYNEKTAFSYRTDSHKSDIVKVSFVDLRDQVRSLSSELIAMGCTGKSCVVIGKLSYEWALTY